MLVLLAWMRSLASKHVLHSACWDVFLKTKYLLQLRCHTRLKVAMDGSLDAPFCT